VLNIPLRRMKMRKIIFMGVIVLFCIAPIWVFAAENSSIDKKSIEFGLGNVFSFSRYGGALYDPAHTKIAMGNYFNGINGGYFIIDRLSIGASIFFYRDKEKDAAEAETRFSVGPVVKYYYPLAQKILVNGMGKVSYESTKSTLETDPLNQLAITVGGAATYLLKPYLGAYAGVNFTLALQGRRGGSSASDTGYNVIDAGIGLTFFL
jgi:hypothetical protein